MTAIFSDDRVYRYYLERTLREPLFTNPQDVMCFVMLNPSTADEVVDDPTIRKCIGFATRTAASRIAVVNLFAVRETDPKAMKKHPEPIGERNDHWIKEAASQSKWVVCAWGNHGLFGGRGRAVYSMLATVKAPGTLLALGRTKRGQPEHPLMIGYDRPLIRCEAPL